MKIVIMRHAKVLIENRKIYANELKACIEEYNNASIETGIKNREELVVNGVVMDLDIYAILKKEYLKK